MNVCGKRDSGKGGGLNKAGSWLFFIGEDEYWLLPTC